MSKADANAETNRFSGPRVTLVQTASTTMGQGTSVLLQSRLRIFASVLATAMLVWIVRGLFLTGSAYLLLQITALVVMAALAAPLWTEHMFTRSRLRLLELILVGVTLVRLGAYGYLVVSDHLAAGADLLALAEVYNTTIAVGALIVVYGMLIPNVWRRTAAVASVIASVPMLGLGALWMFNHAQYVALRSVVGRETITDLALALVISVLTAAAGTQVIYALRHEARVARNMGQYQLQERIAIGGMGEIWRASHRFLARPAAVKVIQADKVDPLDQGAASSVLERFEREAQATATLESLHTVRVYDFGRTDHGEFYYAMELLNGFDCEQLIERFGPIRPARAIHLLLQACDSLAEAHQLGQVHRDVKPSNIFLCKIGLTYDVVKVLDFGLVTRAGSEETRDARLQEEGMAGTPAYMAPEQVLAVTTIDERADLYALGCVAYWMLTGHTVFDIDRPLAMAVAHVKAPPMPPSRRTEMHIPKELEAIIMRCLEKDPKRRPASAQELAGMLLACETRESWGSREAGDWWGQHRPLERRADSA
ncbi:MAG: protein kinase [Acidobacteria bacterium]|nr:protein kinase [Acidobacteriota bacterium]